MPFRDDDAALAERVYLDALLEQYIARIMEAVGPNAGDEAAIARAARLHAVDQSRKYVVPEDIKVAAREILGDRIGDVLETIAVP